MADERTFLLIGDFRDNITSHLEKINDTINTLKQNVGTFGSKRGGFNDLTKSMGKVIGAHVKLKEEVVGLRNEMRNSLPVLREYRREVGKAIGANMQMGGGKRFVKKNNPYLQFLDQATRQTNELAKASRNVQLGRRMPRAPGGGGGGGGGPTRTYTSGARGSDYWDAPAAYGKKGTSPYTKERWGVSRDETFAFGQTLGFTLGSALTGAIVQGFQIGVGLLALPFQHLGDAMKERIADESTDVQTAGAMFAISERKNMKMFSNFNEAIRAQQAINYKLAESAAALPGATTEYVQTGKRVLDSMMTVLSKDVKGVSAFAAELGAKPGDQKDVLATLTQKFTEKAVLLGQGSTYKGAYGVPQLLEQLIGKEDVSENMFNKFAMYRDLPIFQSVFRDMEGEIAKTGAYSAERIRLVFRLLDEALPNEVIQAHKNTMAGFLEATRSAFLDPEVGLFGMGRKIQGIQMASVDQYGNFLNKQKKIVATWDEAEKIQISLYESIQKILTGFGLPLSELASLLPQLFEPFSQLIKPLESTFKVAQSFYRNFNIYTKEFEALAKSFEDRGLKEDAAKMKKSAGARGSLLAIANLLTTFGDMTGGDFTKISKQLQDPNADIGGIAKSVMTSLFSSSFMEDLGFQIGLMIGGVINTVAQMLGFATDTLGESKIIKGLKAGFDSVEGLKAVQYIIRNIFKILFDALLTVFKLAPLEFSVIGAAALLIPAFTSSFSIMVANWLENFLDNTLAGLGKKLKGPKITGDVMERAQLDRARQLYLLDKAKTPKPRGVGITGDVEPVRRKGAARSPSGVAARQVIRNKQFPVALGMYPEMSMGAPRMAPEIPKLPKGAPKGVPVTIRSVAKNAFTKTAGFLGGLPGKMGAGGITGLRNPLGMLGPFGTALVGLTAIIEGVGKLLSGGSIWEALGAAAGPVIGTIIGTALLGPVGGMIGSWIGQQKSVVEGLGRIFEHIGATLSTFGQFVMTLVGDIGWLISKMFNLGDNFDFLGALMKGLEAPFYYMRLGMMEIYALYLKMTARGDSKEAQDLRTQINQVKAEAAAATLAEKLIAQHKAQKEYEKKSGYTPEIMREGTIGSLKAEKMKLAAGEASKDLDQIAIAKRMIAFYEEQLKPKTKPGSTVTPSPVFNQPGTPTPGAPAGSPAAIPQEVKQTAQSTMAINTKAATQVTQGAAIQKSSEETKKNTTTANVTLGSIKAALMSISGQTRGVTQLLGKIQAGMTATYMLLASGSLKVQGGGMMGGMGGRPFRDRFTHRCRRRRPNHQRRQDATGHGPQRRRKSCIRDRTGGATCCQ